MPYNPNYADETYSYEYGGYLDNKAQGYGGRGRGFGGRPPRGHRGRYLCTTALCLNFAPVEHRFLVLDDLCIS